MVISLVLGIFFLTNSITEMKEYKKEVSNLEVIEKEVIMNDVFNVLGSSNGVLEWEEEQLLNVLDKYPKNSISWLFSPQDNRSWLHDKLENTHINQLDTIFILSKNIKG